MALTADVVIIGGGVTGASLAFHLAARGVRDVIVVDKSFVASGGTGKSSACVRQHYSTAETCRMIRYSLDFFQRFEELAGGHSCGFRRTGYLLGVDERMRKPMEASVALQRSVGIETRLVSPAEMLNTPDWHPIMDRVGPEGSYVAVGFSGHGFKLCPAVGRMMAALVTEGPGGDPDLPTFRLSRFAEGKPIRGTYGDWLMC
jgi:glycine/D-amino acid oxidase-like deaminating enzyme